MTRHPLITVTAVAVASTAAVILAFVLVIVPLTHAAARVPGQVARGYSAYFNGVGQQFYQACEQTRGPDCGQYRGTP